LPEIRYLTSAAESSQHSENNAKIGDGVCSWGAAWQLAHFWAGGSFVAINPVTGAGVCPI
jgi:hypothetical protein